MASVENQPISWRRSSRCAANGTCVEIAGLASVPAVAARDATYGDASPVLLFSPTAWRVFTDRIKRGEFAASR